MSGLPREPSTLMAGAEKKARQPAGPQVYVVQRRVMDGELVGRLNGEDCKLTGMTAPVWLDVATVEVPPRSKARTIIERALNAADPAIELPVRLRILDVTAAKERPVGLRPRDPELVIG